MTNLTSTSKVDKQFYLKIILIALALGIIFGAFGAHVLAGVLNEKYLSSFKTAVMYHLICSTVALGLVALSDFFDAKWFKKGMNLLLIGTLLFSGSIYLLSFNSLWQYGFLMWLGPVTPIGGLLMIGSLLLLSFAIKHA